MPNGIPTVDNAIDTGILIDRVANLELYISQTLVPALNSGQVPTGSIMPWSANNNLPTGFLLCNGASVSRTTYAALFDVIGTAFGTASGTTFNLPDFQGRFLRGRDNSAGRDPDASSRTAQNTGGATGDNVGSVQADAFQYHIHKGRFAKNGSPVFGDSYALSYASASAYSQNFYNTLYKSEENGNYGSEPNIKAESGSAAKTSNNETRPVNSAVNFIIKYTANVSL
jgi:microcystin-dependent protein